ncbi:MAG: regulatory protein RecX [Chloroflexi bacterium]|nr:regulatory protein RecX [Chloroflexota bacterium]
MAGTITALKAQKRNPQRVNVYLDGRYAFSLAAIEAARLQCGQVLFDEDIEELQERDSFEKAHDRALRLLSYRPRSEAEVRRYLQGKAVSPAIEEEVVARLTRAGLLDDLAFARYWVENRENFNPRGLRVLRYELRQKGLSEETIAQALTDLDEEESAYRVALRRGRRLAHLDWVSFRQKLGAYLLRRGFPHGVVNLAVERAWQELRAEGENIHESEDGR